MLSTMYMLKVIVIAVLTCVIRTVHGEMFTALVDLEKILHVERDLAVDLKAYINHEEQRLNMLKRLAEDYERHSTLGLSNPEKHLSNPVNAFQLVKRFTTDWDVIVERYIKNNSSAEFLNRLLVKTGKFPDEEDLSGAATALLRLQDTYALDTDTVATGNIQGVNNSPLMTAGDCFELGRIAYTTRDYYHTVMWMAEGIKLLAIEDPPTADKSELLDYLSYATFMQGNPQEALHLTKEFLQLEPNHARGMSNKLYYEQIIAKENAEGKAPPPAIKNERPLDDYRSSTEFAMYERLCRGEKTHVYKYAKLLTCQYRRHNPMFYIRPLHEEVVYLKPRIVLFHNSITDVEIAKIKELATPRLNRATVQNAQTGQLETANYRVSKSAWLKDEENTLIRRVSQRAKAMVNLTLDTVEELQVVNYGIGGHYEPHYDFARKIEVNSFHEEQGNRVATVICYISEVEAGGATVFPEIGVRLQPRKGSCAVWYNLKLSGEGDYDTRHAACPVLTGSKWVCNKWFHERGQEFVRPCSLSAND